MRTQRATAKNKKRCASRYYLIPSWVKNGLSVGRTSLLSCTPFVTESIIPEGRVSVCVVALSVTFECGTNEYLLSDFCIVANPPLERKKYAIRRSCNNLRDFDRNCRWVSLWTTNTQNCSICTSSRDSFRDKITRSKCLWGCYSALATCSFELNPLLEITRVDSNSSFHDGHHRNRRTCRNWTMKYKPVWT